MDRNTYHPLLGVRISALALRHAEDHGSAVGISHATDRLADGCYSSTSTLARRREYLLEVERARLVLRPAHQGENCVVSPFFELIWQISHAGSSRVQVTSGGLAPARTRGAP